MRGRLGPALLAIALLAGCSGSPDEPPTEAELTRRERDSILGASQVLPGAAGVRGALRISDTASARNGRLDLVTDSQ